MAAASSRSINSGSLGPNPEPSVISSLSRRDFLKICSTTAALLGIGQAAPRVMGGDRPGQRVVL